MNIFKNRPLSMIILIMLGGFAVFTLADNVMRIVMAVLTVGTVSSLAIVCFARRKPISSRMKRLIAAFVALLLSFLFSFGTI